MSLGEIRLRSQPAKSQREDVWHYVDDVSGAKVDAKLVAGARKAELDTIAQMGVWKVVDRRPTRRQEGHRGPLGGPEQRGQREAQLPQQVRSQRLLGYYAR